MPGDVIAVRIPLRRVLTVTSDARIRKLITSTITSDARVILLKTVTITSDARIRKLLELTTTSDARIIITVTSTITSDAYIMPLRKPRILDTRLNAERIQETRMR